MSMRSLEMGKIKAEGDGEVQEMNRHRRLRRWPVADALRPNDALRAPGPPHVRAVGTPSASSASSAAFNFPVAVWAWNACIAAVCGNISVWKPSPKAALCAIAVQKICNEALAEGGYPEIFHLFVESDVAMAEAFVDDPRVNLVSFTGSCAVGRRVGERVAARMGKCLLELGGNNAIIVDEHANLDLAVPAIVFGAVGTAGQRCTSTRRVLVHQRLMDELAHRLVNAYRQVRTRIGDPMDPATLMGPLIDQDSVLRYERAIEQLLAAGGQVLTGGHVLDRPGNFVEPTIAKARNDWTIVQEETFGPILYLISCGDLDEAIAMHNSVRQGLSSAIFTDNVQHAEYFLSHGGSDCGIANVNIGTSGAEIGGAFGGEKETGGGREAGSDAWKAYMRRQTNTINWGKDLPLAQGINFDL